MLYFQVSAGVIYSQWDTQENPLGKRLTTLLLCLSRRAVSIDILQGVWGHVQIHPPQVSRYGKAAQKICRWLVRYVLPCLFSNTLSQTPSRLETMWSFLQKLPIPLPIRHVRIGWLFDTDTIFCTIFATCQFFRGHSETALEGGYCLMLLMSNLHSRKFGQLN